ncbi:ABC transporter ATP-binding protein [Ilumatobacter coccineus]|uniref:Putative FeS assembly ATPase SufC n=1 Tax=Ilumatobacter coccineus (strain NBRC 103263 / KCTC 29153 / YM16-304) TaxID=1313172 RepID=A0A6C7E4G3_ILUCY|nr:putative FeS assembly ATPase SufC [Ilumatobacter coccineus]BAN01797.1 putative FeS assembly ATPase SufC [Ilumatobacter coccineus YM16-304]
MTNAGATDSALTGDAPLLAVRNLHAAPDDGDVATMPGAAQGCVLRGVDLTIGVGELHAIVGDASTAAIGPVLMGSPAHRVTDGSIHLRGDDVTDWPVDERAKAGLFLSFPRPTPIPGVSVRRLLHRAESANARSRSSAQAAHGTAGDWARRVGLDADAVDSPAAGDLSEHQSELQPLTEIVQLAVLQPALAVLDLTDSPSDAAVARAVRLVCSERPHMAVLLIAPSPRLLAEIAPHRVHSFVGGRIVASGGLELTQQLERSDHESFQKVGV